MFKICTSRKNQTSYIFLTNPNLSLTENSSPNSKSTSDPAKEPPNQIPPSTDCHSPDSPNHATTTSATSTTNTTAPAVCGGDCGNIMCSLNPSCIEESFEEEQQKTAKCPTPEAAATKSDEGSDGEDSLRRRTKSEGCYTNAYRAKSRRSVS